MVEEILNIYKPVGISPLEAINLFRENNPEYKEVKMTYAGRLDPLAEGVLIVLAGEAVHEKDEYLKLDKKYEAEILFGFETDTYDILGLIIKQIKMSDVQRHSLEEGLKNIKGDYTFILPPYSSYKIEGKPLFQWAREGRLNEIEIPKRTTKIYDIKLAKGRPLQEISGGELLGKIIKKIDLVKGDFRQEEIKKKWGEVLNRMSDVGRHSCELNSFYIGNINVHCSSGTYVRSIANELGGVLLSLKRTQVGEFKISLPYGKFPSGR